MADNNETNSEKIPLLATGLNGLVGSKFTQLFQNKYTFDGLDVRHPTNPVDITDKQAVDQAIGQSQAQSLIHLAAFTNVTAAWKQNNDKNGLAYQVNVIGTQNIVETCQKYHKHLIHISTAYVFDGEKDEVYLESDQPNPIEWYGQTKLEAEKIVTNSDLNWAILRIDQPFRSDPFEKTDMAHKIIQGLTANELYPMFDNHYFGPTYINDFAKVLDFFVSQQKTGLFHATSGEKWSDFTFAQIIKEQLNLPGDIKKGDLNDYLKKLDRPYQRSTALDNNKLAAELSFELKSVKQAVAEIEI
ncbi:MAG: sugar nucleotide-binding protein [Patescibacteria group bacterium]|nr:sugar nucleotide-binding protein [Patescibacteria group bacterium]